MSGFVATAPLMAADPPATDAIVNDGWFPDQSLATLRDLVRLDGTVTDVRLRDAVRYAIACVNWQLLEFRASQVALGVTNLAAVDPAAIDGEPRLVMLYRRAVASTAKADLIERYRDLDSTDSGLRRAVDMDPSIDEQRRNARWAVRDILGLPHSTVELI